MLTKIPDPLNPRQSDEQSGHVKTENLALLLHKNIFDGGEATRGLQFVG
jgi:hypothetical protein